MLDLDLELMVSHVRVKCVCLIQFIAKIKPSRWNDFSPYLFAYYFCQYISNSLVMVYKHGDRKIQNKTNTEKLLQQKTLSCFQRSKNEDILISKVFLDAIASLELGYESE